MDNYKLGRMVLSQIDADLSSFDMRNFAKTHTCKTVACIAGHTLIAAGYYCSDGVFFYPQGHKQAGQLVSVDLSAEARELLGLEDSEYYDAGPLGESLFYWIDNTAALAFFRAAVEASEQAAQEQANAISTLYLHTPPVRHDNPS